MCRYACIFICINIEGKQKHLSKWQLGRAKKRIIMYA